MSNENEFDVDTAASVIATIIGIAVVALLFFYLIFAGGYVFSVLWGWFVVPIFSLPVLTWAQSAGILTVIDLAIYQAKPKDVKYNMTGVFLAPWMFLAIGWLIKTLFL